MAKQLTYRLTNPGYTIYHRAALGGLAATIRAWGKNPPEGIEPEVTRDTVGLGWADDITEREALRRVLACSFKLTRDKLIDLPGHGIRAGQDDLRLAIHNGIMGTFLDHNSAYSAEKQKRQFGLKVDDETEAIFTYKALNSYAHQDALDRIHLFNKKGKRSDTGIVPKWALPGAFTGAHALEASFDEAFLLLFLIVGCGIFLLRPRTFNEKAQYCLAVPDVIDLIAFARALTYVANRARSLKRYSSNYLDRIVAGAEEGALCFLIGLKAEEVVSERSVNGCLAITIGKVSWDKKQNNRSLSVKLKDDYSELSIFLAAEQYLSNPRIIRLDSGEGFARQESPVPELVAANLATERHWCAHFKSLVGDKKDFNRMKFIQGGLKRMKEAIKDADDQAIIRAFHDAWRRTMGALYERATREHLNPDRLIEVERERLRNAILRAKTADTLAGWFLRFCADATKGASLAAMREERERIRKFIFNPRNVDRFQNLCLFALVSYSADETKAATGGAN